MEIIQSRRDFLTSASMAAAAGVLGARGSLADEGPPETTTIRIVSYPSVCTAPQYVAEELLRLEGFTDVRYVPTEYTDLVARGEADFDFQTAPWIASYVDAGSPIAALAGVHPGCYELFAQETIGTISDLKGKRVGIDALGEAGHLYLALMVAHVGLDPRTDVDWITSPGASNFMELLAQGKVDAFLAFPPEPQELHARKLGHSILNLTTDKPWSQYFCCMAYSHTAFIREYPIATKRALRAILKAADLCVTDPERAAQGLIDGGWTSRYDFALQTLTDLPYASWREYDPADTMRFYALRLHEVGMIKSTPQEIIAAGTDWRFLNEIKRELKA
jgi:NitT/TauT family transport system substrate-binding protein